MSNSGSLINYMALALPLSSASIDEVSTHLMAGERKSILLSAMRKCQRLSKKNSKEGSMHTIKHTLNRWQTSHIFQTISGERDSRIDSGEGWNRVDFRVELPTHSSWIASQRSPTLICLRNCHLNEEISPFCEWQVFRTNEDQSELLTMATVMARAPSSSSNRCETRMKIELRTYARHFMCFHSQYLKRSASFIRNLTQIHLWSLSPQPTKSARALLALVREVTQPSSREKTVHL